MIVSVVDNGIEFSQPMSEIIDTPLPEADAQAGTQIDLHVHTRYRDRAYASEDVHHGPRESIAAARARGLGGLAITGHDTFEGLQEAVNAGQEHGVLVVTGAEISTFSMQRGRPSFGHIVGLFPTDVALDFERRGQRPPRLRSPQRIVDWISEHGGVASAAHAKPEGGVISLSYKQVRKLRGLHAIETHNKNGENPELAEIARQRGIASVGGSDSHHPDSVGTVRTLVLGVCNTADDVLEAIKSGRVLGIADSSIPPELHGSRTLREHLHGRLARVGSKITARRQH